MTNSSVARCSFAILLITLIVAIGAPGPARPQDRGIESQVRPNAPTAQVKALLDAGVAAQSAKQPALEKAEQLFKQALAAAEGLNDRYGQAKAQLYLGNVSM
jgi:hypothetical protein